MIEQVLFYWRRYGFLALVRKIYQKLFKVTVVHGMNPVEIDELKHSALTPFVVFDDPQKACRLSLVTELQSRNQSMLDLALLLSVTLASQWERPLRIISPRETSKYRFNRLMQACVINYTDNIDFRSLEYCNAGKALEVSSEEYFIATSWQLVWKLMASINDRQIICLVHEQPESSSLTAVDTANYLKVFQNSNIHFVFASRSLYEQFVSNSTVLREQSVWLNLEPSSNLLTETESAANHWQIIFNGISGYLDKVKTNVSA